MTHARRATARIAVVLAAAVATITTAPTVPATATPTRPSGGEPVCFVVLRNGVPVGPMCVWIPILTVDKPPRPCPQCSALSFDFPPEVTTDEAVRVNELVVDGLGLLVESNLATNPTNAARLRVGALDRFNAAATTLGEHSLAVGSTGYYDTRAGEYTSSPTPWLRAAGVDISRGLGLLWLASIDPDGDPAVAHQAELRFDEAYGELTVRTAIGD
jgi:hypothetical protein